MKLTSIETSTVLAGLGLLQRSDTLPSEIDSILTQSGKHPRVFDADIESLRGRFDEASSTDRFETLLETLVSRFGPALDRDEELDGGDTVEWLAEFIPRVYEELRKPRIVPRVIVTMEGGLIHNISSDAPVDVMVIDYDTEGLDEGLITQVGQTDGSGNVTGYQNAYVTLPGAELSPEWIEFQFGATAVAPAATDPIVELSEQLRMALGDASTVIGDLAAGWPEKELHRSPDELRGQLAVLGLRLDRIATRPAASAPAQS